MSILIQACRISRFNCVQPLMQAFSLIFVLFVRSLPETRPGRIGRGGVEWRIGWLDLRIVRL